MSTNVCLGKTAIIVLGGGLRKVTDQGRTIYEPEDQAKARLDKAYELFEEGQADYIISTGKYGPMVRVDPDVTGPQTEAEVGGQYLLARSRARAGAASHASRSIEDCILYEDRSIDTIGNAWFAKKLCLEPQGITSCIVVTSDYHIERTRVIFEWVLGPKYTVVCAEAPSALSGAERERRDRFERMLTDYVKTHLAGTITAGDDEAIAEYMDGEHKRMFEEIAGKLPGPPPEVAFQGAQ